MGFYRFYRGSTGVIHVLQGFYRFYGGYTGSTGVLQVLQGFIKVHRKPNYIKSYKMWYASYKISLDIL